MSDKPSNAAIPDWFDLEKYRQCSCLSLADWGLNLELRSHAMHAAKNRGKWKWLQEWYDGSLKLIKAYGVVPREELADRYEEARGDIVLSLKRSGNAALGLVYDVPIFHAYEMYDAIHRDSELRHTLELVRYQGIFHHDRKEPISASERELKRWYEEEFMVTPVDSYYPDCALASHICVELDAPDDLIITAFKEWLARQRATGGGDIKKVSEKLVARWSRAAILPYLDLMIYSEGNHTRLPLHLIGSAIFAGDADIDTTEAVRKTTRPMAEAALRRWPEIQRQGLIAEEIGRATS